MIELFEHVGRTEGIDRKRRDPHREIAVDGPTSIGPDRPMEKLFAEPGNGMIRGAYARQAHQYEACQWNRFEKAAAGWLDALQYSKTAGTRKPAHRARDGVRRAPLMNQLPQRDESRKRIAHHRKLK